VFLSPLPGLVGMRGPDPRLAPWAAFFRRSAAAHIGEWSYIRASLWSLHQQMPGFFVGGVFGFIAVGGEEDIGLGVGGGEGEDVPDVGGDDVGGEEVDLGGSVGDAVVVEAAAVGIFLAALEGAFDLHAEEVAEMVDGEVVGSVVSPGLGEDEAEFGGAEHEAEFGPFAAEFVVRDVWSGVGHGVSFVETGFGWLGMIEEWSPVKAESRFLAMGPLGMTILIIKSFGK
jgi:hypothetical protein